MTRPAQETTLQKYEQFATRPKVFVKTFGRSAENAYFCRKIQYMASMMAIAQKIRQTPMAPYVDIMQGMSRREKLVLMAFLVDSMQEQDIHETTKEKQMIKPNPFSNFRKADQFSLEERTRILEKMRKTSISPETKSLVDGLSLTKDELQDERTRYILGLDR